MSSGTYARRAERRIEAHGAPPAPTYSQTELRQGLRVHYTGAFNLTREVKAIIAGLSNRVAAEPHPLVWRGPVGDVADAVHELVSFAVGLAAESDGHAKGAHLTGSDRRKALRTLADLARRPTAPEITDAALTAGDWAALLVAQAEPHAAPLAAVLSRALPPGDFRLAGVASVSERLEAQLRQLDMAALTLTRRLDRTAFFRSQQPNPEPTDQAQTARAALAELGVTP